MIRNLNNIGKAYRCKYKIACHNFSFTFSKDTLSLKAVRMVTPYEVNPPTQVGSTSASARNVKAASIRT